MKVGRFPEVLNVYNRLVGLAPDDTQGLERSADVFERLGRLEDAGRRYVLLTDVYLTKRNVDRAIAYWDRAVSPVPRESV